VVVSQFAPGPALAAFVRAFEIVETQEETATRTLLPDTGIVLGFRYAGSATQLDDADPSLNPLPDSAVTGLRTSTREMRTSAHAGIVLAKFRAAGAAAFFREPLHHLFGTTRALDELMEGEEIARTSRQIACAKSNDERVAILQQFLLAQRQSSPSDPDPDPIVSGALRAICGAAGAIRVRGLARDLHVSQDTLDRRFRRIVGASPKQFASIVRLRHAVELSRERASLTMLALDAGYYDQSHFIRDFRAITGDAPGHFFERATYC
jgi:AraC-like DNA-binding protein